VLASERYVQVLASADQLLRIGSLTDASGQVEVEAPELIERPYRKLRKVGDKLDERSAATELHAARIRAKRLRYAVEFVADVYGRPAHRFVRRVTELQDLLGKHQDAHVAADQLRAMVAQQATNLPDEVIFVMGELAQRHAADAAELRARFCVNV
jgi:triphosphatase